MKTVPSNLPNDKVTQDYAIYCTGTADCAGVGTNATCDTGSHTCANNDCTGTGYSDSCGACQSCTASKCTVPGVTDSCLLAGIP
jgi:hypothetical protein